jgi:hypothetical protein
MDAGVATALAAIIAAVASIISLAVNLSASKRAEMRAAHRQAISSYLAGLSDDLHTIIAGVVVMRKRVARGADVTRWREQSKRAGQRVDRVRRKTTFLLAGLDHPLRQLALASDHVATYKDIPNSNADELIAAYRKLGDRISRALASNYRKGTPTGPVSRWRLELAADKVVKVWDARPSRPAASSD